MPSSELVLVPSTSAVVSVAIHYILIYVSLFIEKHILKEKVKGVSMKKKVINDSGKNQKERTNH